MAKSKWHIKEAVRIVEEAALEGLRTGAEKILTEAIDEAPVESGTLRRSGTVTIGSIPDGTQVYEAAESGTDMSDAYPKPVGKEKAVYISFNTPYARRQHEEIGYNHPLGGKAKYLEDPFNRNKEKALKYAALKVKKAIKDTK
ncbi:MAG TPA: hypothetical protein GXX36_03345 [Clostridiaceae bacterium]|nr:hypothetical protein [Clostridiaceae bacterium]